MRTSQQLNELKVFCRASSQQRLRAGLVFLVLAASFGLLVLAAHAKIDIGWWFGPCGFKQKYNLPCPTCGMTASALAFARCEIFKAFYSQPAAALFCCLLAVVAFLAFIIAAFGVYFVFLNRFFTEVNIRHIILAMMVVMAAAWAVTLIRALVANSQG
ncbi:MAG: DUF2752 domain-containing protein [Planctomycetota bacterium]|nr:MAG: DUF2752 domain-containing protein [Planctomycetota bacterium]